ncbi:hypothetical protein FA95DRAFT_1573720 [Auriscalpium vulgare]|uniref:Uncharacterized protein n=1 Tax=Auriscalpium vulgare TaxID=40419 RepID=A0ACB8RN73_9AGAM|nr:hypothetical protein FA95DRAFT_1573720 [Auriscalpium vulgare]
MHQVILPYDVHVESIDSVYRDSQNRTAARSAHAPSSANHGQPSHRSSSSADRGISPPRSFSNGHLFRYFSAVLRVFLATTTVECAMITNDYLDILAACPNVTALFLRLTSHATAKGDLLPWLRRLNLKLTYLSVRGGGAGIVTAIAGIWPSLEGLDVYGWKTNPSEFRWFNTLRKTPRTMVDQYNSFTKMWGFTGADVSGLRELDLRGTNGCSLNQTSVLEQLASLRFDGELPGQLVLDICTRLETLVFVGCPTGKEVAQPQTPSPHVAYLADGDLPCAGDMAHLLAALCALPALRLVTTTRAMPLEAREELARACGVELAVYETSSMFRRPSIDAIPPSCNFTVSVPLDVLIIIIEWVYRSSQHNTIDYSTLPPHLVAYVRSMSLVLAGKKGNDVDVLELCTNVVGISIAITGDYFTSDRYSHHNERAFVARLQAIPVRPIYLRIMGNSGLANQIINIWPSIRAISWYTDGSAILPHTLQIFEACPWNISTPISLRPMAVGAPALCDLELHKADWTEARQWVSVFPSRTLAQLRTLVLGYGSDVPPRALLEALPRLETLVLTRLPEQDYALPLALGHLGYHFHGGREERVAHARLLLDAARALTGLRLVTATRWSSQEVLEELERACRDRGVDFRVYDEPGCFQGRDYAFLDGGLKKGTPVLCAEVSRRSSKIDALQHNIRSSQAGNEAGNLGIG